MSEWMPLVLLAQHDRIRALGENFRGEHARVSTHEVLLGLALLACGVVGLWMLSQHLARREKALRLYSPRRLFKQLCDAHGLPRAARKTLKRLAHVHELENPARLFLEPERFDISEGQSVQQQEAYRALKRKLFGDLECKA